VKKLRIPPPGLKNGGIRIDISRKKRGRIKTSSRARGEHIRDKERERTEDINERSVCGARKGGSLAGIERLHSRLLS